MQNKRKAPRTTCFLRGKALLSQSSTPVPIEIYDLSSTGMRVKLEDVKNLPRCFLVEAPKRHIVENVAVVWYNKKEIGLSFIPPKTYKK